MLQLPQMNAGANCKGLIPLIHIIVVVVSPITLPAPPALAAATMAAWNRIVTPFGSTWRAMTPPMIAPAMLSEKDRQAEYECEQRNAAQPAVREPRWY